MVTIELECKHCGTKEAVRNLPVSLGDWLIHQGKDVFCSLMCVTAYTDDLRLKMQEESREADRKIMWSKGEIAGTISGNKFSNVEGQGNPTPPAQGGSG